MHFKLCEIIGCRCWNLFSAISLAIHNLLLRCQSPTNLLYAIYYLPMVTKKLKDDWMDKDVEGPNDDDDVGMVLELNAIKTSDKRWTRRLDVTCCSLGGGSV